MLISDFFSKITMSIWAHVFLIILQNANMVANGKVNCVMSPNRALATETLLVGVT
jgi:hypothetical protein